MHHLCRRIESIGVGASWLAASLNEGSGVYAKKPVGCGFRPARKALSSLAIDQLQIKDGVA
ncbi:hypothetical protein BQ8482_380135 [Mesorhizobium delmotii]|uniref:Uncharacterized protein n=1 Tax=Mesorhizobium delmotii TaxID=1631247 RepID=A0A2P9AS21_9HYPH|nr:hypothetical protein BQ8482_380135 [Mesorhizobium delmotii]